MTPGKRSHASTTAAESSRGGAAAHLFGTKLGAQDSPSGDKCRGRAAIPFSIDSMAEYVNIADWDVSRITDMKCLFSADREVRE